MVHKFVDHKFVYRHHAMTNFNKIIIFALPTLSYIPEVKEEDKATH